MSILLLVALLSFWTPTTYPAPECDEEDVKINQVMDLEVCLDYPPTRTKPML